MKRLERKYDFFDIKADLIAMLEASQITESKLRFVPEAKKYYHPGMNVMLTICLRNFNL